MASSYTAVAAGTTCAPVFVTPLTNVLVGPSVLGGSVTLEYCPTLVGQYVSVYTGSAAYAFRPLTNGYVRVSAATSKGQLILSDMGSAISGGNGGMLANINVPIGSASTTSEVILAAIKIPPNFLPNSWRLNFRGNVSLSNNANVKTLKLYANGTGGTAMATSPSIASALNYTFESWIEGRGDGSSIIGGGVLASQTSAQGGYGITTTANPTLTRDYLTQETEFTLTATKATAGDTFQLEALSISLTV